MNLETIPEDVLRDILKEAETKLIVEKSTRKVYAFWHHVYENFIERGVTELLLKS